MKLNPGIAKTVAMLNAAGYDTCDSGDGETHEFECDREGPYVVIQLPLGSDLVRTCDGLLLFLLSIVNLNGISRISNGEILIQGNYGPVDGFLFVDISGISDKDLL